MPAARKPRRSRKPTAPPKRRPSPKLDRALREIADAAVRGERITVQEAANRAGMARETLSRVLHRADVASRALDLVRQRLGGAALIAAAGRLEGLITGAKSEYVALDAAKHTLALAGVKPREEATPAGGVTVNLILKHVQRPAVPLELVDAAPALMAPDGPPER